MKSVMQSTGIYAIYRGNAKLKFGSNLILVFPEFLVIIDSKPLALLHSKLLYL